MVAVYAAGYVITQPASVRMEQVLPTSSSDAVGRGLRDGTYLGSGESRFGSVYVTVQVVGGRINQVWINSVSTTFPAQVIAAMPGAVVTRQDAGVDLVSGATGSSSAFVLAVSAALRQARA